MTKVLKISVRYNQTCVTSFLKSEKRIHGKEYPSSSMYDLISELSLYLEREHGFTDKLVSGAFRAVRNTLDNVMKKDLLRGWGEA